MMEKEDLKRGVGGEEGDGGGGGGVRIY